jgi:hypothetical protein
MDLRRAEIANRLPERFQRQRRPRRHGSITLS